MSKTHYLRCKSLHSLQQFASTTKNIQVENRQYASVLFKIPVIIDIQGQSQMSNLYLGLDLVLGIKSTLALEGINNSKESYFSSLCGLIPFFFSKRTNYIETKGQIFMKIEAPLIDEISALVIEKMLDKKMQCT